MGKETIKRFWLRKRGTNIVVQWTKIQANKPDMYAISEDEAKKAGKLKAAEDARAREIANMPDEQKKAMATKRAANMKEQHENSLVPPEEVEEPAAKTLDTMNETELRAFAAENKLPVPDDMPEEAIRESIKTAMSPSSKPVDDTEEHIKPAPEDPPPPEDPEAPTADSRSYKELQAACKAAGISAAGKADELRAKLVEAGK